MIKRPNRNRKVPLVWAGPKNKDQVFQKWDPISKRLITVNCCPAVPIPPPPPPIVYQFIQQNTTNGEDPPLPPNSGRFGIAPISPGNFLFSINVTDKNSQDASSLITSLTTATYIKIQKDISNYYLLIPLSNTDNTTYWDFNCNIFSTVGFIDYGDTVVISPA